MSKNTGFDAATTTLILDRDQGRCARCGRYVVHLARGLSWSIHHREPRGRGGAGKRRTWVNLTSNGVVLCTACHDHIEKHRAESVAAGWLVSALGITRPAAIPILHAIYGMVRLADDGTTTPA